MIYIGIWDFILYNNFVADSLTSTVINLQRDTTLFIHSDIVRGDNNNILQEYMQQTQLIIVI